MQTIFGLRTFQTGFLLISFVGYPSGLHDCYFKVTHAKNCDVLSGIIKAVITNQRSPVSKGTINLF